MFLSSVNKPFKKCLRLHTQWQISSNRAAIGWLKITAP